MFLCLVITCLQALGSSAQKARGEKEMTGGKGPWLFQLLSWGSVDCRWNQWCGVWSVSGTGLHPLLSAISCSLRQSVYKWAINKLSALSTRSSNPRLILNCNLQLCLGQTDVAPNAPYIGTYPLQCVQGQCVRGTVSGSATVLCKIFRELLFSCQGTEYRNIRSNRSCQLLAPWTDSTIQYGCGWFSTQLQHSHNPWSPLAWRTISNSFLNMFIELTSTAFCTKNFTASLYLRRNVTSPPS